MMATLSGICAELRRAIRKYVTAHNKRYAKPFTWTKDVDAIIAKVKRTRSRAAQ